MKTPALYSYPTRRAIALYGTAVCFLAAHECDARGNGANTISHTVPVLKPGCTRQADAAINAGREIRDTKAPGVLDTLRAEAKAKGCRIDTSDRAGCFHFYDRDGGHADCASLADVAYYVSRETRTGTAAVY